MADSQDMTRVVPDSATQVKEVCPSTTAAGLHCKSGKQPMNDIKQAVQSSIFSASGLTEPACLIPSAVTSMDNSSKEFGSLVETQTTQQVACEVKAKDLLMTGRRKSPRKYCKLFEMKGEPVNASEILTETKSLPLDKHSLDASEISNLKREKSETTFRMTMNVDGFSIEVNEVEIEPSDTQKNTPKRPKSVSKAASNNPSVQHSVVIQMAEDLIPKRPKDEDVKRNMRKILETGDPVYQFKKRNIDVKSSIFHVPVVVHNEECDHDYCDLNHSHNITTLSSMLSLENQPNYAVANNPEFNAPEMVSKAIKPEAHLDSNHKQVPRNYTKVSKAVAGNQWLTDLENNRPKMTGNYRNIPKAETDFSYLKCSSIDYKMTSKPTTIDLDLSKTKSLLPESPMPGHRARRRAQKEFAEKKALENLEESNHPAKRPKLDSKRNTSTNTEFIRSKAKMKGMSVKTKNLENDPHLAELLLSYARTIESVVSSSNAENNNLVQRDPNEAGPEDSNRLDDLNHSHNITTLSSMLSLENQPNYAVANSPEFNAPEMVSKASKPEAHLGSNHKQVPRNYTKVSKAVARNQWLTDLENNRPKMTGNYRNIPKAETDFSYLNCSSIDYKMTSKPTTIDLDLSKTKSLLPESPMPSHRARLRAQKEFAEKKALENLEESNHPAKRPKLDSKRNTSTNTEFIRSKAKMKGMSVKTKNLENDPHLAELLLSSARTIESVVSSSNAENNNLVQRDPNEAGPEDSNRLDDPAADLVDCLPIKSEKVDHHLKASEVVKME